MTRQDAISRLIEAGLDPFPLWLLRKTRTDGCGVWLPWIVMCSFAFCAFELIFWSFDLVWQVHAAYILALSGIVLCYGGALWGLSQLMCLSPYFGNALRGPPGEIENRFTKTLRKYVSFKRTTVIAVVFGFLITTTAYFQSADSLAQPLSFEIVFFLTVFISASGIGFGHVCILAALMLVRLIHHFGMKDFFVMHSLQAISGVFFKLSWVSLLVYLNYLAYLVITRSAGVEFTLGVALITAFVGFVVFILTVWPQLVIFYEITRHKTEALDLAQEELRKGSTKDTNYHPRRIATFQNICVIADQPQIWRKLGVIGALLSGYLLPIGKFLYSQDHFKEGIQRLMRWLLL